jgi:hypothetical protein
MRAASSTWNLPGPTSVVLVTWASVSWTSTPSHCSASGLPVATAAEVTAAGAGTSASPVTEKSVTALMVSWLLS